MDKKVIFTINIQSVSDIITNSSSETFVINGANIPREILQKELETINKSYPRWFDVYQDYQTFRNLPIEEQDKFEGASGDGGTIKVNSGRQHQEFRNKSSRVSACSRLR